MQSWSQASHLGQVANPRPEQGPSSFGFVVDFATFVGLVFEVDFEADFVLDFDFTVESSLVVFAADFCLFILAVRFVNFSDAQVPRTAGR